MSALEGKQEKRSASRTGFHLILYSIPWRHLNMLRVQNFCPSASIKMGSDYAGWACRLSLLVFTRGEVCHYCCKRVICTQNEKQVKQHCTSLGKKEETQPGGLRVEPTLTRYLLDTRTSNTGHQDQKLLPQIYSFVSHSKHWCEISSMCHPAPLSEASTLLSMGFTSY